ncbi:MAG TPA: hypothetical protein VF484_10230 [Candidatus Limnocylindrales bacterium]
MSRIPRSLVLAVVATVLVSGVAVAGKPVSGGTPAGQAWATTSGNNPIPLPGSDTPEVVTNISLPSDGKFVINATVLVYNSSTTDEPLVDCTLRHGIAPGGGTVLDIAEVRLPTANVNGLGETKLALTGAVERVAQSSSVTVFVTCSSNLAAGAQFGQMNVVSVSTLTVQ